MDDEDLKYFNLKFDMLNEKIDKVESGLNEKIDKVELGLNEKINKIDGKVDNIINNDLEHLKLDLMELKTIKNYILPILAFMIGVLGVVIAIVSILMR
ncbi:MAG: hypothetical protein LBT10_07450 [Methanobrevibacter sp.]|jgi:SMC interacting uncharacterized protein involved in chromosome segregation|nr:hypothetical protein [Methanobrevibacter sp.]